jgi:hypothetical protein
MKENLDDSFIEMVDTVIIVSIDGDRKLVPTEEFELKFHEGMPYLNLEDIAIQLEAKFGQDIIIDVWYELGIKGYIYRYGNYGRYWVEHGTTRGYA